MQFCSARYGPDQGPSSQPHDWKEVLIRRYRRSRQHGNDRIRNSMIWHIRTRLRPRACMEDPCAFILLLVGFSWIVNHGATAVNDTFRHRPKYISAFNSLTTIFIGGGKAVSGNIRVELVRLFMTVPRVHIYRIRINRQVVSPPQYGAGPRLRNDEPTPRDHAIDAILSCEWMLRLGQPGGLCYHSDS